MSSNKLITALCLVPALVVGGVLAAAAGPPPGRVEEPAPPVAAPAPDNKEEEKAGPKVDPDVAKIAGEWKVKHVETNGEGLLSDEQLKKARMTFKDGTAEVKGFEVLGSGKFSFTLDSAKTPKEIDIKLLQGPQQGDTFQGIYLVRKNEMRMCLRLEGTQFGRPKGYVTTSGTTLYTFILEPVEPKAAAAPIRAKEVSPPPPPPPPAVPPGVVRN